MTRDFDLVGSIPFRADSVETALSSIQNALGVLRTTSDKGPPLPPVRLTPADRLLGESLVAD